MLASALVAMHLTVAASYAMGLRCCESLRRRNSRHIVLTRDSVCAPLCAPLCTTPGCWPVVPVCTTDSSRIQRQQQPHGDARRPQPATGGPARSATRVGRPGGAAAGPLAPAGGACAVQAHTADACLCAWTGVTHVHVAALRLGARDCRVCACAWAGWMASAGSTSACRPEVRPGCIVAAAHAPHCTTRSHAVTLNRCRPSRLNGQTVEARRTQ